MAHEVTKIMEILKFRRSQQRLSQALHSVPEFLKSDIGVEGAPVSRAHYGDLHSVAAAARVSTAHRQVSAF
jgi:DNA-binding SARP family transcriptional activator